MARYGDLDMLAVKWIQATPTQKQNFKQIIDTHPTSDVVPKSEGCEFCGTTLYVKTVQHTMPLLAPITRADELRHELLNLTGEIYLPLEAKFCPVCGAKMKGGAE